MKFLENLGDKIKSCFKENYAIIAVVAVFLALAFYNFGDQGLIQIDEGYYLSVVHTYSTVFRAILFSPADLLSSGFYVDLMKNYGTVYTSAKPVFILLSAFVDAFYQSVYSTRLLNISATAAMLVVFYKILSFYSFDKNQRILSTVLLISSPLFLVYSRNGLSVMLAACFLLLSLYYLLKAEGGEPAEIRKNLFLTGSFAALAAMSHYGSFFSVGVIGLGGLIILKRNLASGGGYLRYLLSFVVIPFVWQGMTWVIQVVAKMRNLSSLKSNSVLYSYFGEIAEQFRRADAAKGLNFQDPFAYLKFFSFSDGLVVSLLLVIGLIYFLKGWRQFRFFIVIALAIGSLAFISLSTLKYTRVFIPLLPFFYLIAVLPLSKINKKTALLILAAVLLLNISSYKNILQLHGGFPDASDFIKNNYSQAEVVIYSPAASILRNYLPGYKIEGMGEMEGADFKPDGDRQNIAVIDFFHPGDVKYLDRYSSQLIESYPVNVFDVPQVVGDTGINEAFKTANNERREVGIYEIK